MFTMYGNLGTTPWCNSSSNFSDFHLFDFTLMFEISLLFLYQIFFLHFFALLKKYFRIYEHLILKVIYVFFSKDAIYHEIAFPQNRHWFALIFSVGFLFYAVIIPSGCNICSVDKLLYSPVRLHHVLITRYIPIKPGSRHNYYSSVPCNFLSNQRWLSEVKYK